VGTRFVSLLVKESIQFCRDKAMLALILFFYTLDTVMCTMALTFDVKDLELAVVDLDASSVSRQLIERFTVAQEFKVVGYPRSEAEAEAWLQSGRAMIVLIVPRDFAGDLLQAKAPQVQLVVDGTNSNIAAIARGYVLKIITAYSSAWSQRAGPSVPVYLLPSHSLSVQPLTRIRYNQNLEFSSFMVLSMIALAAMMVGVVQPAASIVREKEVGTVEQLLVTPITTAELFIAKTLPTLLMCLLAVFPGLLVVRAFDVPLRGSLPLFLALTTLFLISAIGLGVLIASVTKTLQQALLTSVFGLIPILFLSGTLAPVESMPRILQTVSLASPLRHYMEIILGVFLKGAGIAELWPQALALLAIGTVLLTAAALAFRRR
jgi:ABC-2 type transport system permease protein